MSIDIRVQAAIIEELNKDAGPLCSNCTLNAGCKIYETRPQVCRDLARGSSACLAERTAKAERPLLTLRSTVR